MNDTEETKVAGPSGPRISIGPAGRSLFSLTGPTVNILATGQRLRRPLPYQPVMQSRVDMDRGMVAGMIWKRFLSYTSDKLIYEANKQNEIIK